MSNKALAWLLGGAALVALILAVSFSTFNVRVMPLAVGSSSFATTSSAGMTAPEEFRMMDASVAYDEYAKADMAMVPPQPQTTAGPTAAEVDQKIIRTGFLDIEVENVAETESGISALATGVGGYVQDSDVSERNDGTHFGNITVRIPSKEFDAAMTAIKNLAAIVRTESSQAQDVTEQYTDLEAQLRNAKAQETEYLKILTQAKTVEEILNVQSYLSSIRYQIESLEGRVQYLENVTSYSTISVGLSEEPSVRIPTKGFNLFSTLKEAFQALVAVAQNLAVLLVWLVVIGGGTLIPLALVVWAVVHIVRAVRRRR